MTGTPLTDRPLRRHGAGPGPITPDGCAVAVYTRLPPAGEGTVIDSAVSADSSILELGAGTGRITRQLTAAGHRVTAVDESADMLRHNTGVTTVRADITALRLPDRFDAVVLASFLVNTYRPEQRAAMLAACRRHVADDGCVLVQRHRPEYFAETTARLGELTVSTRDVRYPEPEVVEATLEYRWRDQLWRHRFQERLLDEPALAHCLAEAGLTVDRYLNSDHTWLRAVPTSSGW